MKKIEIKNEKEVLNSLKSGRIVEGRLALVKTDDGGQQLEFVAYNRKNKRKKDKLIKELEHGWVKESAQRLKFFSSVKKSLGTARVIGVLERETNAAKDALIDRELDFVPFP